MKWIPTSERLPEPDSSVLVTTRGCPDYVQTMLFDYLSEWKGLDYYDDVITAWMPLPEPYSELGK